MRDVKLGVISITVKINITFMEYTAKEKEVDDEEKVPQDRTLGHT